MATTTKRARCIANLGGAMNTRAERSEHPQGFTETGILTHKGQDFAAGGAYVSDDVLYCYPRPIGIETVGPSGGRVETWSGEAIGNYFVTGQSRGFHNVRLTCYRVRLDDGREYVGRGLGAGMILKCKRAKSAQEGR